MFDVGSNHCDKWDGKHNKGIYFLCLLRLLILVYCVAILLLGEK